MNVTLQQVFVTYANDDVTSEYDLKSEFWVSGKNFLSLQKWNPDGFLLLLNYQRNKDI